ncbi:MAG: dTMP kinase [Chloroherpetonaceae bacterium]|nr:dTMP kinase [Chloroherpetonaceae bacterium]
MLISFEGIDGSGKTTQVKLLKTYLHTAGLETLAVREPGGVPTAESIRQLLLKSQHEIHPTTELLLFAASRAELCQAVILPALQKDVIVILNRFYDSTVAYQGFGRGIDLDVIRTINRIAAFGLVPTLTFYLDILPEDALMRKFSEKSLPLAFDKKDLPLDRMESAGLDFYYRVREGYRTLVQQEPERFVMLDALRSVSDLHQEIVMHVQKKLAQTRAT